MCGITAIIESNGRLQSAEDLESMLNVAARRGPESQDSIETLRGTLLGHTMLGFVEVNNNNQPYQLQNTNGNSTLVWNGEIYGLLKERGRVDTSIHGWRDVADHYGIEATTDTESAVQDSDVAIVIVSALLTKEFFADLNNLETVTHQIHNAMHKGLLISYETTVPVGTTREIFLPILSKGGWKVGADFYLAFSPERVKSQHVLEKLTKIPKIVGGVDEASTLMAEKFYTTYLGAKVINVGTTDSSEMVKLTGMIFRDVNIALANELAGYSEAKSINFTELIEAINSDGEANLLLPGIGVGGHCAPVYPYFMIHDADHIMQPVTLSKRAREINDKQAEHMIYRLERSLGSLVNKKILILGLGFRPGVKEHYLSTAFKIKYILEQKRAEVSIHDSL